MIQSRSYMPAVRNLLAASGGPLTSREGTVFFASFLGCLLLLAGFSIYFFPHVIDGDAVGYESAVRVFAGGEQPYISPGIPEHTLDVVTVHRILMTPLSVTTLYLFSELFGSIVPGWIVWDTIFFFGASVLFYLLMRRFFRSDRVAFVGALFFAGNYAMVTSGLGMFVDIAAWFFYILALWLVLLYSESGRYRLLVYAAIAIALGGLFKENAYVACIPIAFVLLLEYYRSPLMLLARGIPLAALVAAPAVFHHTAIYLQYGYTYAYWIHLAQDVYEYPSLIAEYVKNFGSLLTLLAPLSLGGAILFFQDTERSGLDMKKKVFLASVLISSIPAILWPALEQRVLFLVVPGLVLLAGILIQRFEKYWYAFLPLAALYILAGFLMDAYILDFVNLPF